MATLHGILSGLGIETPMQSTPDPAHDANWVTDGHFDPVEGGSYALAFARIPHKADEPRVIRRVRIDGPTIEEWFDLDRRMPLERALYAYAVKAYRPLDDDEAAAMGASIEGGPKGGDVH